MAGKFYHRQTYFLSLKLLTRKGCKGLNITSYFSHRPLPGTYEQPTGDENSLSGCSGLGIDTEQNFGLVYKAVGKECGIYRSYIRGEAPTTYVSHRLVQMHGYKCKFYHREKI